MLVRVMNNQTIVAANGTAVMIKSDPIGLGSMNSYNLTGTLHGWVGPAGTLDLACEGSNDGVYYYSITAAAVSIVDSTSTSVSQSTGIIQAGCAYIRVTALLTVTGGASGDIGAVAFDAQVNTIEY